jgi:pimeloyl-ACP methyl ester carboxylesterase
MMRHLARIAAKTLAICITTSLGCAAPKAIRPIRSLVYSRSGGEPRTAVLLLPGRYSRAEDFARNGFVAAVRGHHLDVEIVAVDAHLGYYLQDRYKDLPDIIDADVVTPLLKRGHERVWFVGTSLGALGCIAYAKKYPDRVAGLLLMGAYLGEDPIIEDIQRAGGLRQWQPTPAVGYDYEVRTWQWLQGYFDHQSRPELFLGYGASDRFAPASKILASALPASHVLLAPNGAHDFDTWANLWVRFLDCCGQELEQMPDASIRGVTSQSGSYRNRVPVRPLSPLERADP